MIDYSLIITTNYKKCGYSVCDNDYNSLIWDNNNPIKKPTKEELDAQWDEVLSIRKKEDCKTVAQKLLAESDFADLYSVRNVLENVSEWDNYRSALRQLRTNPVEHPEFPDKPHVRWVSNNVGGNLDS